jgi:hypothetical protein
MKEAVLHFGNAAVYDRYLDVCKWLVERRLRRVGRTHGGVGSQRRSRPDLALGTALCAPELNRRCRRELRMTNRSWRVDETYLRGFRRCDD